MFLKKIDFGENFLSVWEMKIQFLERPGQTLAGFLGKIF